MLAHRASCGARSAYRLPRLLLVVAALSAGVAGARAQTAAPPPAEQDEVVTVRSNLVNIDVMVRVRDGKYLSDLKSEDFTVYENGTPQAALCVSAVKSDLLNTHAQWEGR